MLKFSVLFLVLVGCASAPKEADPTPVPDKAGPSIQELVTDALASNDDPQLVQLRLMNIMLGQTIIGREDQRAHAKSVMTPAQRQMVELEQFLRLIGVESLDGSGMVAWSPSDAQLPSDTSGSATE